MNPSPSLPLAEPADLARSQALLALITAEIDRHHGWLPFSRYMELALYAPQYGYYSGGGNPFGAGGDFVTAPTLSPLFGQTLARQLADLLPQTAGVVYEFGAGNGALAASLLNSLPADQLHRYCIIEVSPQLADLQRQHIARHAPDAAAKVHHLSRLPAQLDGVVIGNEVLDALPVEVVRHHRGHWQQQGVVHQAGKLDWQTRPLPDAAWARAVTGLPAIEGYQTELHPQQQALTATVAQKLVRGALIWIDYGFDAAQYHHPQRDQGTLIGHYRHHSVHDVFFQPGLTDLTAHVNFTAIAEAAVDQGLDLVGYTSQANFLLNLGITDLLAATGEHDSADYIRAAAACQMLLSPHEMGELFKVMAFGRQVDVDWRGFRHGDLCHKL